MKSWKSRRQFLQTAGVFTIGFSLFGCSSKPSGSMVTEPLFDAEEVDAWLQVLPGGEVRILTGKMDLGQGLKVVLQQVAGEELNLSPSRIKIVLADTGLTQNEGYTAGSRTVERSAMNLRKAAATARENLLQMAADKWNLGIDQIQMKDGFIQHPSQDDSFDLAALLPETGVIGTIRQDVPLKPKDQYQWVGRPLPHPDLEKTITGEAVFIQDLRFENMVHARVLHPPVPGAQLAGLGKTVGELPGVVKIVVDGSFAGVIAESEFDAVRAWEKMQSSSRWLPGSAPPDTGDGKGLFPSSPANNHHSNGTTIRATYTKPYLMHGSIGPSCAIAIYRDGGLQIWSHSQGVYPLRRTIAHLLGMNESLIRITGVRGAGCYGHNGADDAAAEAALLARAYPGVPVRLMWMREDEHLVEPYGSAMKMELAATLDDQGKITSWQYDLWSDRHSTRPRGDAGNFFSARHLTSAFPFQGRLTVGGGSRNSEPYYDLSQPLINEHYVAGPLRTSALRSLGAYANILAIECFMDELAQRAGIDPFSFRLMHLQDERAISVIERLQEAIKTAPNTDDNGIGIGFSRYKNQAAYCAVAARVQVDQEAQTVTPVKMWAVIDAGETINPDGLSNQTEGGMIQAASWTLKEAVQWNGREVTSRNWATYPVLRFRQAPETEVLVINRPELPPLGAGEAAQGPAAAAIVNAVFAATGKRVRNMPVEKWLWI